MFYAYKEVSCRQVGEDYLAHSDLSSETISLTDFAYKTLRSLMDQSMSLSELISLHECFFNDVDSDELSIMLKTTINELSIRGFIYQSSEVI